MTSRLNQLLQTSADIQSDILNRHDLNELDSLLDYLQQLNQQSGVVRIVGDRASAAAADHLHEELVIRFKAGSPFGRPDRAAVNSRNYSDYSNSQIVDLIMNGSFNSQSDLLVCFACADCKDLAKIIEAASQKGIPSVVIASATAQALCELARWKIVIPSENFNLIYYFQTIALHTFCERLEPEFEQNQHGLKAILKSGLGLVEKIISDKIFNDSIIAAQLAVSQAIANKAAIFLAGNGGSACDINNLISSVYLSKQKTIEIFSLHSTGALLAAYNDGYAPFARQIEASAKQGDVFIVYSTSGNSQNLLDAVQLAKSNGVVTIGMLGRDGGKLANVCDYSIIVPSGETARIQEVHGLIGAALLN